MERTSPRSLSRLPVRRRIEGGFVARLNPDLAMAGHPVDLRGGIAILGVLINYGMRARQQHHPIGVSQQRGFPSHPVDGCVEGDRGSSDHGRPLASAGVVSSGGWASVGRPRRVRSQLQARSRTIASATIPIIATKVCGVSFSV